MKNIKIILCTLIALCTLISCKSDIKENTTSTSQATQATANSEFNNSNSVIFKEYLDYFIENKINIIILSNNNGAFETDEYRLHFYQTFDNDIPEMIVEKRTVYIPDGNRNFYNNSFYYYHMDNNITKIDSRGDMYYDDNNSSFNSALFIDSNNNYCEIITENNNRGAFVSKNIIGDGERPFELFSSYSTESSAKLRDYMTGFLLPNSNLYPDDIFKDYKNKDTGKYEMYIISQKVIDSIGDVDFIEPTCYFNSYVVTKDIYSKAYEEYMSQFTAVEETPKYTSQWFSADEEPDIDKIVEEACKVFENNEKY